MPALILILVSIVLPGCSVNPEPDVAKTENANQSLIVSNNNINQSPAVLNNNNIHAGSPNASTPTVNNTAASIVNVSKDMKPLPPVKAPTPNIGSGGSDIFLFTQARGALSSDKELLNAVIIEIKEGNVTLTGKVSSEDQKTKAGRLVQNVTGIKSVKNNLRVSS